jgi:protease-4
MRSYTSKRTLKSPNDKPKRQSRLKKWAGRFFIGIGITSFIGFILMMITVWSLFSSLNQREEVSLSLPREFILYYELKNSLPETRIDVSNPFFSQFADQGVSLDRFLHALDKAASDDRVREFVVRMYDSDYSLTQLNEMRQSVIEFREISGKKTRLITDGFGNFSNGIAEYWFASAFEEITLQPMGLVSLTGIHLEQPFAKDAFDKIGVEFELEQRKDFKTAPETMTANDMSRESRITLKAIIDEMMDQMVSDIAEGRGMTEEAVMKIIDNAPVIGAEALELGLIDHLRSSEAFNDDVQEGKKKDDRWWFIFLERYAKSLNGEYLKPRANTKVALINVNGAIMSDDNNVMQNSALGRTFIPSDFAYARDIRRTIRDLNDRIEVLILRINSPGGSPVASEEIRNAILGAQERGIYVIVSMSDVAASGGYWIAAPADYIIASPLTITGSIGVYGGKANIAELWDKIGVNWVAMQAGRNASMWSMNEGYSASEKRRLDAMMDHIYDSFVKIVAEGRELDIATVEKAAKGRAWTGSDALRYGLVDELGGFELALIHAAEKAGYDHWQDMPYSIWPKMDDPFENIARLLGLPSGQALLPEIGLPREALYFLTPEAIAMMPPLRMRH